MFQYQHHHVSRPDIDAIQAAIDSIHHYEDTSTLRWPPTDLPLPDDFRRAREVRTAFVKEQTMDWSARLFGRALGRCHDSSGGLIEA